MIKYERAGTLIGVSGVARLIPRAHTLKPMAADASRIQQLEKENTFMRGLVSKLGIPCVYCGLADISKCARGFPGCAQGDDLMCADEEMFKDLLDQNRKLKTVAKAAEAFAISKGIEGHVSVCECKGCLLRNALNAIPSAPAPPPASAPPQPDS